MTNIAGTTTNSNVNSEIVEKQTLSKYFASAMLNFKRTDGLLWALVYIFLLTFICYPGLATDNTVHFLQNITSTTNYSS